MQGLETRVSHMRRGASTGAVVGVEPGWYEARRRPAWLRSCFSNLLPVQQWRERERERGTFSLTSGPR